MPERQKKEKKAKSSTALLVTRVKARKECKTLEFTKNALNVSSSHGEYLVEVMQESLRNAKNVRKRGTQMMKCRVCAWRVLRDVPQYDDERRNSTITS